MNDVESTIHNINNQSMQQLAEDTERVIRKQSDVDRD